MSLNHQLSKYTLGTQLTLIFIATYTIAIVVIGFIDYNRQVRNTEASKTVRITGLARSIATIINLDVYENNYVVVEQQLSALGGLDEIDLITIFSPRGLVLIELEASKDGNMIPTYRYGIADPDFDTEHANYTSDGSLLVRVPVSFSGQIVAWMSITSGDDNIQSFKYQIILEILAIGVSILLVTSLTTIFFLRLRLASLAVLTDFSANLPQGRGNTITLHSTTSELSALMNSLNWASGQIKQQQELLETHNLMLEHRVAERTRELEAAKNEAVRASQVKSEFLSRMSHELRTPLNAILGFAQVLGLEEGRLDEGQQENLDEILKAGHHLLFLINEILDLGKIESGKMEVFLEPVSVGEIIDDCLPLIRQLANHRHITVVDNTNGHQCQVLADFSRLKQVLINLLSNAVKYNRDGGEVRITQEFTAPDTLRISVTDDGEGMTDTQVESLFSPFHRLNPTVNVEGAGIGLVISKSLVELMDGKIGVISMPGQGSTFWIELPGTNRIGNQSKIG
ncbi:MAG: ATP-binding protein [Gammaproteobacteria bacterium]|nr:ATP-binding protein [Gammaproteobacteria bacterium]